jgi:hypothetical protein
MLMLPTSTPILLCSMHLKRYETILWRLLNEDADSPQMTCLGCLGKEHSEKMMSVDNLAIVLRYHGKHEAAEELNRWTVEGSKKGLG